VYLIHSTVCLQVKRAEAAAGAASANKKRKLTPTNVKVGGKKSKAVKATARKCKDAKLVQMSKYVETKRATPETPCTSFLDSYNRAEETIPKGVMVDKTGPKK